MSWTDDKIAQLVDQWGKASAAVIGKAVGKPKNAVIGKAHRLGLQQTGAGARLDLTPPSKPKTANTNRRPRRTKKAPPSKQVRLADLTEQQCRYPHGDRPADIRFCGHPVMERGDWRAPYCEYHQGRCYTAPELRRASKARNSKKRGRLSLAIPT